MLPKLRMPLRFALTNQDSVYNSLKILRLVRFGSSLLGDISREATEVEQGLGCFVLLREQVESFTALGPHF